MSQIKQQAVISNIPVVTDFIDGILEEAGCSMMAQVQIDVAIDEIFSNICYYAYEEGSPGEASVSIDIAGSPPVATLVFTDEGVPYNPLEKEDPDVTLSAEERDIGGLGIFMVKKTMDDMAYEYVDGRNVLTIKKAL